MDYHLFRLTIKGSMAECLVEIDRRGLSSIACIKFDKDRYCSIDVESSYAYLWAWYIEPAKCLDGIGFPSGNLLQFTPHNKYTKPLV